MDTVKFKELLKLMERLRGPEGCPWDREQTFHTLIPCLIEEAYEVVEAIELEERGKLQEELGDLLFQIIFLAQMAKENGWFEMKDILATSLEKMVRRHPHVFGNKKAKNAQEALARWRAMKEEEKVKKKAEGSLFSEVPHQLPAIMRAQKITEKASKVGFDWKKSDEVLKKVEEEIGELRQAIESGDKPRIEDELGDTLFAMVNLGRFVDTDVEHALRKATNKFISRFEYMAGEIEKKKDITKASLEEMEKHWHEAKANVKR
jgi:tetrapyrrole methylase family protein/MazG family protein